MKCKEQVNSNFKYQDYYNIIDRSQKFNASWTLQTILIQREELDTYQRASDMLRKLQRKEVHD
jgi:hypothetical protein